MLNDPFDIYSDRSGDHPYNADILACRYCGRNSRLLTVSHDVCPRCEGEEPDRSDWHIWIELPDGTRVGPWRTWGTAADFAGVHGARVYEEWR